MPPQLTVRRQTIALRSFAAHIWNIWRERGERPAQILLLTAGVASFLSAAGTVHALYTLQVSYIMAAAGILVGGPWAVSGWSNSGSWLRWSSVALVVVYSISLVAGHPGSIPGSPHTGRSREFVYMVDLCVGLGTVGVIAGIWGTKAHSPPISSALILGSALAAAYAVYQWFGLHFHWPSTHVNNILDSNGVTSGASQGIGVLGWERARGTFLEPHFLGTYLASLWPLCVGAALTVARPLAKQCLWVTALLSLAALFATDSAPAWASLTLVCVATVGVVAIGRGQPALAAVAVSATIGALALAPITGIQQGVAASTGRSSGAVTLTTHFRTETWSRALELWAQQPILGAGPGQASVRLTRLGADRTLLPNLAPGALLSAQGLWAAALLDAGLLGLTAWLLFLGGLICATARSVFSDFSYHVVSLLAAIMVALIASFTTGDRLELWVWLLLGAALAAAGDTARNTSRNSRQQSSTGAQHRA